MIILIIHDHRREYQLTSSESELLRTSDMKAGFDSDKSGVKCLRSIRMQQKVFWQSARKSKILPQICHKIEKFRKIWQK